MAIPTRARPTGAVMALLSVLTPATTVWAQPAARTPAASRPPAGIDLARLAGIDEVVERAIVARQLPGAVVVVGRGDTVVYEKAFGQRAVAPVAEPMSLDTIFDLASLTKVLATVPFAIHAVELGRVGLDTRVADRVRHWRSDDRSMATVADLLEHCAGLTAHLPFYRDHVGRADIEHSIATLPLEYAVGSRSTYSDLGFMLLAWILEDALETGLPAFVAQLAGMLGSGTLGFRPAHALRARIAPTGTSPWRGRPLVGEVHDDNGALLGGVAGHAGLFGTAADVGRWAQAWIGGLEGDQGTPFGAARSLRRFMQRSRVPGSSRALGWDTMLPTSSCGTLMSPDAVGHTGFTGTSLWIDHRRGLYVVLLTNRVHPDASNQAILGVRRAVHDAAIEAFSA
jgi:CubicO group peptidase (beta-lactamase class C family)